MLSVVLAPKASVGNILPRCGTLHHSIDNRSAQFWASMLPPPLSNFRRLNLQYRSSHQLLHLHIQSPISHQLPILIHENGCRIHQPLNQHPFLLLLPPFTLVLPLPKSLLDSLNHLPEPVKIERVQHDIAAQIHARKPRRHHHFPGKAHQFIPIPNWLEPPLSPQVSGGGRVVVQADPDVLIYSDGLVGAPEQAAAEEAREEEQAIVPLVDGTGHVQFVEEPVEVKEGG